MLLVGDIYFSISYKFVTRAQGAIQKTGDTLGSHQIKNFLDLLTSDFNASVI